MKKRPKKRPEKRPEAPSENRLGKALDALVAELDERIRRHPSGRRPSPADAEEVQLTLRLPVGASSEDLLRLSARLAEDLQAEVENLLARGSLSVPGRVRCLRCGSSTCEHSEPRTPQQVFSHYGPTGVPEFVEWPQYLLEQGEDPNPLFLRKPRLVVTVQSGEHLTAELLDAYRDDEIDYHLEGQVAAGWYQLPGGESLAVTFQVISSGRRGGARRYDLNVVGVGLEGRRLAEQWETGGGVRRTRKGDGLPPWQEQVDWARSVLAQIELSTRGGNEKAQVQAPVRIGGLLEGLARRLGKRERSSGRRTRHAERRRRQPERPTDKALADLAQAADSKILYDTREDTLVVLGGRGRVHVFSQAGKHVTSLHVEPDAVDRRSRVGKWRSARTEEIAALRSALDGASVRGEEAAHDAGAPG